MINAELRGLGLVDADFLVFQKNCPRGQFSAWAGASATQSARPIATPNDKLATRCDAAKAKNFFICVHLRGNSAFLQFRVTEIWPRG